MEFDARGAVETIESKNRMAAIDITPANFVEPYVKVTLDTFLAATDAIKIDDSEDFLSEIEFLRSKYQRHIGQGKSHADLQAEALVNVFADLIQQGWRIARRGGRYLGTVQVAADSDGEREQKRQRFLVRRNEQLRRGSIRKFITSMERQKRFDGDLVSIFSLMRDGRDLAENLESINSMNPEDWRKAISPYLSFVGGGATCPYTGYSLQDIWRYFRHSWSNPYESVPGRTLQFLIRDGAVPFHPIIGIGALSSASIGLGKRDEYIGWTESSVVEMFRVAPAPKLTNWLTSTLDRLISEIYRSDFIEEGLVPAVLPDDVNEEIIQRLEEEAEKAKNSHFKTLNRSDNKLQSLDGAAPDEMWKVQATTALFRGKRSAELASLMRLKNELISLLKDAPKRKRASAILETAKGRKLLSSVVRAAKATTVGTEIADLTVCGALPPYNELLGGKLVAALSVCPSVVHEYKRRYSGVASVIASSMAGRRVERANNLVFVATTSLYGKRPNQYDRINIPCEMIGGQKGESIRFKYLGISEDGVGTFQFGKATKNAVEKFAMASKNGFWRANNVFGEGVSPKLRSLRDGLSALGLPHEDLLRHGMSKSIYGVSLLQNLRDYLLGMDSKPKYRFDVRNPKWVEDALVTWWFTRWATKRTTDKLSLDKIRSHTLVRPVRHGARVHLPDEDVDQLSLPTE